MLARTTLKLAAAAMLAAIPLSARAEYRDFTGASGAVFKAELKKAKGAMIILQGTDGKEKQIAFKSFSKADQDYILRWMDLDPKALDYNFRCKETEKLLESVKMRGYYERSGIQRKAYDLAISNGSQCAMDGVTMEYRLFFEDKVEPYSSGGGMSVLSIPKVSFKTGEVELPKLNFNGTFNFTTKAYSLHMQKDSYYYGGTRGAQVKDRLLGVWLRFYRHGTLVFEWKSQGTPKCEWPGGTTQVPKEFKWSDLEKPTGTPATPTPTPTPAPAPPKEKPAPPAKKADEDSGSDDDATILKIFELDDKK